MLGKNEAYDDRGRVVRKSSKAYRKARRLASVTVVVREHQPQRESKQHGKRRHKSKNTVLKPSYSTDQKRAYLWRRDRQRRRRAA